MPPLPDQQAPRADAEFFQRALEQDVANILEKVNAGQPLTKREREMVEEERTRRQNLEQPSLILECDGETNALGRMTQKELAAEWGYSVRAVKGWLAQGREKKDPAPLCRPAEMPAWFERTHAPRKCPEKLRMASQRLAAGAKSQPAAAAAARAPVERIEIAAEEKGMLAMLNRYRDAEATLHAKYMAAVDEGDETRAHFLLSEWSRMGEKMRALEKVAPRALEDLGIYVRKDEIQRELEPLHAAVLKGFRQALRLARPRLKATTGADEWNRTVDAIVSEVGAMLVETDFVEPLELVGT